MRLGSVLVSGACLACSLLLPLGDYDSQPDAACTTSGSDPKNCGVCERSCVTEECRNDLCTPTTSNLLSPYPLVLADGGTLFAGSATTCVLAYNASDLQLGTSLPAGCAGNVVGLRLGSSFHLVTTNGGLFADAAPDADDRRSHYIRLALDGAVQRDVPLDAGVLTDLVVSNSFVVDVTIEGDAGGLYGVDTDFVKLGSGVGAFRAVSDANTTYWTDRIVGGAVHETPITGGDTVFAPTDSGLPWGVAIDSAYVYFTDCKAGTINRRRKDKTSGVEVIATTARPGAIAVDKDWVFFSTISGTDARCAGNLEHTSTVQRVAKDGHSAPLVIAKDLGVPHFIVVRDDDPYVYFTSVKLPGNEPGLFKVAK